jgi:hypothetical protein
VKRLLAVGGVWPPSHHALLLTSLQIWRLICGRIICLDLKDAFCSGLLIYNFRIFERRYGSRKFAVSYPML